MFLEPLSLLESNLVTSANPVDFEELAAETKQRDVVQQAWS